MLICASCLVAIVGSAGSFVLLYIVQSFVAACCSVVYEDELAATVTVNQYDYDYDHE